MFHLQSLTGKEDFSFNPLQWGFSFLTICTSFTVSACLGFQSPSMGLFFFNHFGALVIQTAIRCFNPLQGGFSFLTICTSFTVSACLVFQSPSMGLFFFNHFGVLVIQTAIRCFNPLQWGFSFLTRVWSHITERTEVSIPFNGAFLF